MKILLVEDDVAYRNSLQLLLEKEGYQVVAVGDAISGVEEIGLNTYDLVISDLKMEIMDGNRFISFVKRANPMTRTIILTGHPTSESEIQALDNDVDYYLTKDIHADVLLKYLQKVLTETKTKSKAVFTSKNENLVLDVGARKVLIDDEEFHLTKKEFNILQLLLENSGKAISREDIIEKLWDVPHEDVDERAIDVHIKVIRKKLKVSSIVSVRGYGYKWDE